MRRAVILLALFALVFGAGRALEHVDEGLASTVGLLCGLAALGISLVAAVRRARAEGRPVISRDPEDYR